MAVGNMVNRVEVAVETVVGVAAEDAAGVAAGAGTFAVPVVRGEEIVLLCHTSRREIICMEICLRAACRSRDATDATTSVTGMNMNNALHKLLFSTPMQQWHCPQLTITYSSVRTNSRSNFIDSIDNTSAIRLQALLGHHFFW